MKSSHVGIGLVGLAVVGLWYAGGGASPPATRAADAPRVAAPLTHANLSVYLVFGPDTVPGAKLMSLQEALAGALAVVHETSSVNTLAIENRSSEYELFVQSGDIVKGGQQDRVVQYDMLLPPNSGVVPLPAHCVEQSRWSGRGKEDAAKFDTSEYFAAGRGLRAANYFGQQQAVWANVKDNQNRLNENLKSNVNAAASPTSFQLSLESDTVRATVSEYEAALRALPDDRGGNVVGAVFAVNGQVVSAEVYASNALFRKAWPKLLYASAVEAVFERDRPAAAPPPPSEVELFLAQGPDAGRAATAAPQPAPLNDLTNEEPGLHANLDAALPELNRAEVQRLSRDQRALVSNVDNVAGRRDETRLANPGVVNDGRAFRGRSGATRLNLDRPGPGFDAVPEPAPEAVQVIQTFGNRLNSNRNESNGTLTVESRDSGRGGAVIHRSYIKK